MSSSLSPDHTIWLAPSKTNLYLAIGPQQANGYHTLATCFAPLHLHDTLRVLIKNSTGVNNSHIQLDCHPKLLTENPDDNLVVRAAHAFFAACNPRPSVHCQIELNKQIPVQAGMGGGSSNAATTLLALNKHPALPTLSNDTLLHIAKTLGADVPYFLNPTLAWGKDRGDCLTPISAPQPWPAWPVLVVQPNHCPIPTPHAFKTWALSRTTTHPPETMDAFLERTYKHQQQFERLFKNQPSLIPSQLEALIHNDFETVLMSQYPILDHIAHTMKHLGIARPWLSGSGSAMLGILPDTFCNISTEQSPTQTVFNTKIAPMFEELNCTTWLTQLGSPCPTGDCKI